VSQKPSLIILSDLENTFLSISQIVDSLMPFLTPIKWLDLHLKEDTNVVIIRVKESIFIIS
jgi:hypothetical protein